MTTEIVEMFWGCTSCGANKNRGRFKGCETCGAPRSTSSPEFMPDDVQAAPAVTDPTLLEKFSGGEDWSCKYCGKATFRADKSCKHCGSPQDDSTATAQTIEPTALPSSDEAPLLKPSKAWSVGAAAVFLLAALLYALLHPRTYNVSVQSVSWTATVHLNRYAIRTHESFAEKIPSEALSREDLGLRHHHDERLFDHYDSVPYTVQELEGYRSESYTASQACGQTCYSTPRTCTSNKNGSATCYGGGQSCSTRYCTVIKTRMVPHYHPVVHFRQEPRYRYEPRFATWFKWRAWEWGPDHDVTRAGHSTKVTWPTSEDLTLKLADGEQQRASSELSMAVEMRSGDEKFAYAPKTAAELARFQVGSKHTVKKAPLGGVEIVDR